MREREKSGSVGIGQSQTSDIGTVDLVFVLDPALMDDASDDKRLETLRAVTTGSPILSEERLANVKRCLSYNATITKSRIRSELFSILTQWFKQVKKLHSSSRARQRDPDLLEEFHEFILRDFIDSGLERARCFPVVRAILALSILSSYLNVFGGLEGFQDRIFSADRVEILLSCQASTFTEVRSRARSILDSAKIPLPGYEIIDTPHSRLLITSALQLINHSRKTEAEAGKAALCILFEKLLAEPPDPTEAIAFVSQLADQLDRHIRAVEEDLATGIVDYPLSGIISAICDLIGSVKLNEDVIERWRPLFLRLSDDVDRIWNATRAVVSLAPAEDVNGEMVDHEIARAYQVLAMGGSGDDEEGDLEHTSLLAACWRATKDAADLLSSILCGPLVHLSPTQTIWTYQDIDAGGRRFLVWFHEVRHRGTFSKITSAFTRLVETLDGVSDLKPLCQIWLQAELDTISSGRISTTRRSAALPYAISALVSSDRERLDYAFDRLIQLAKLDGESSDDTRIHAFNILKIVLLDSRQSYLFDRYFERAVITALAAFGSSNWNVRNVGLILFSTLVHRTFPSSAGSQNPFASSDTLARRKTLYEWHTRFPSVLPHLTAELKKASTTPNSLSQSPVFPILHILRGLKWSEEGDGLAQDLRPWVSPFVGNHQWQLREIASQAYSSLFSPSESLAYLQNMPTKLIAASSPDARHGLMATCKYIHRQGLVSSCDQTTANELYLDMERLVRSTTTRHISPVLAQSIIECAISLLDNLETPSSNRQGLLKKLSDACHRLLINPPNSPGSRLVIETSVKYTLDNESDISFLLTKKTSPSILLAIIEELSEQESGHFEAAPKGLYQLNSFTEADDISPEVLQAILNVLVHRSASDALGDHIGLTGSDTLASKLLNLVDNTKNIPMKEAALGVAGRAIFNCWIRDLKPHGPVASMIMKLSALMTKACDVNESRPMRFAALRSLQPFAPLLFPSNANTASLPPMTMVPFHQKLLRLLQDDDEEIRSGAAEIVAKGTETSPTCQTRAMELEWQWLGETYEWGGTDRINLAWELFLDLQGFEHDLSIISTVGRRAHDVLFEFEPQNLFRDPLVDMAYAVKLLAGLPHPLTGEEFKAWEQGELTLKSLHSRAEVALLQLPGPSPIDRAFEARRMILKRMEVQLTIFA